MLRQTCRTCNPSHATTCSTAFKPQPLRTLGLSLGVITIIAIAMLALTALVHPAMAQTSPEAPSATRQTELIRFVRQECGFCHGLHLTGGLGTPLTAQALDGKSPEALAATILYGRTGTAMPAWTPHLNEADAGWIVAALQRGFPE